MEKHAAFGRFRSLLVASLSPPRESRCVTGRRREYGDDDDDGSERIEKKEERKSPAYSTLVFSLGYSRISEIRASRLVTDCSIVVSGYVDNTVTVNLIFAR